MEVVDAVAEQSTTITACCVWHSGKGVRGVESANCTRTHVVHTVKISKEVVDLVAEQNTTITACCGC